MWQTLRLSPQKNPASTDSTGTARELIQSTARLLILATGGLYAAWYFASIATRAFDGRVWLLTALVLPVVFLPLYLLPRRLLLALVLWHLGLAAALVAAAGLFQTPEVLLFASLLPLMAVLTFGWPAGLLAEAGLVGAVLALERAPTLFFLPPSYSAVIVVGGLVSGLLGWAASHSLFTVLEWALFSFAQAQTNMEEARQHRGQMATVVKDLDQAYYRLERANAALAAAWAAADQAERFKTEFVTNVSHELRTPLNLIVGFSEIMLTAPESYAGLQLPGPYRSDLNSIYHSAQHLLSLVDDVLDLARIEVGKIMLAREDVDIVALVTDALSLVRDYINNKGLELRVDFEPDLPPLWIDHLRIRQVLLNLLVNAARFTDHGWIGVSLSRQGDAVLVKVSDSGRGIPPQDLPKIFEEFRTTEQPTSAWHSGTGLGLPISKKFVELHQGRMEVESIPGRGTTFWFTLPSAPVASRAAAEDGARAIWPGSQRDDLVVVVHEDLQVIPLLQHYLPSVRLVGATSLAEGVALAEEARALALVSEAGPGLGSVPPAFPLITCPLPSSRRVARALGAVDFLLKPVAAHDLLAALDRIDKPIRRVLIAEEDPELARLFRRMLRSRIAPPDCLEAYSAAEALRLAAETLPDLVLLSLEISRGQGRHVLAQLAALPALAGLPVILISGQSTDYLREALPSPIQLSRAEGFQLAEVVQTLEAMFSVLAPSWRRRAPPPTGPAPAAAPPASPASADTPPLPASPPAVAR